VTDYPAAFEEVNLKAIDVLRETFGLRIGYSDHTLGTSVALAAVARGAVVLEKHFTLDRNLPGPDHRASLEPEELAGLVRGVREIEIALGAARKEPTPGELRNRGVARRSLVAAAPIRRGERFTGANVTFKRPAGGLEPIRYWDLLGRESRRDYAPDEMIET
jgi:N-acetylneuraminate synthase